MSALEIALWVITGLLAVAFLFAGLNKMLRSRDQLSKLGMTYVEDFSDNAMRGIGLAEVLGAIGLILPPLTGIAPILAPIAATGLAVTMPGAIIVHLRREETGAITPAAVLLVLAVVVAWGRFGPYAF